MDPNVQAYVQAIGNAYAARQSAPVALAQLLTIAPQLHAYLNGLLRNLRPGFDLTKQLAPSLRLPKDDRFVAFVNALLLYVARQPPTAQLVSPGPPLLPLQAYVPAYEAWAGVYAKASAVFTLPEAGWFGPTLRHVGIVLVHMAAKADKTVPPGQPQHVCVTDAASRLSKSAGLAAIDRTPLRASETKRIEVLWLANASFRAYFRLNNLRLCDTVLQSIESAFALNRQFAAPGDAHMGGGDAAEVCYSRADRVAYRYYVGRLRLMQHRIRQAHGHLRWAFDNCIVQSRNKRLILIPLLVSSLILGIYPNRALLVAAELDDQFGPLLDRLRLGDGAGMMRELDRWREWHRAHGNYLLLRERLQVGIWRNLMRRCFLITRATSEANGVSAAPSPAPGAPPAAPKPSPPPNIYLKDFLPMAKLSWQDDSLTMEDVECVVDSLIDQGLVKGYVYHAAQRVILRRSDDCGFPPLSEGT